MKILDLIRTQRDALAAERAALLAEIDAFGAELEGEADEARSARFAVEATRSSVIVDRLKVIKTDDAGLAEREAEVAEAVAAAERARQAPTYIPKSDPQEVDVRTATRQQLIDGVLRANEDKIEDGDNQSHFERVLKRHASDRDWASGILARSAPAYTSGFAKIITGRSHELDHEERVALSTVTNANGLFLLPTHLDPTIILTNNGSINVMRQLARTVTLTDGKTWNGISSAGVTASFDAQLTEVSDDSPTFGNPQIGTHKAQAFVMASIEAFEDIDNLGTDVMMMFADARDRLEGAAFVTGAGSGSNSPRGIFTALDANTNVEITSTTAATIGEVDLAGLYAAVGQRWRGRSSWLMAPTYALAIKRLGTAVSSSFSGDLTMAVSDRILGRPLYESDDAPTTQTTTVRDNEIVLGDFSNYVIVDKPGSMQVEFIPHLFNTANNLPDGRRAWYAYWRTGGDSVNDLAFRLLQDKTSA